VLSLSRSHAPEGVGVKGVRRRRGSLPVGALLATVAFIMVWTILTFTYLYITIAVQAAPNVGVSRVSYTNVGSAGPWWNPIYVDLLSVRTVHTAGTVPLRIEQVILTTDLGVITLAPDNPTYTVTGAGLILDTDGLYDNWTLYPGGEGRVLVWVYYQGENPFYTSGEEYSIIIQYNHITKVRSFIAP